MYDTIDLHLDDFSRVKVAQVDKPDDDTDYINASFIDVRNISYAYIHISAISQLLLHCGYFQ